MECIKILSRNQIFVSSVKVINDAAETGIKLNPDYAALLTDDPMQRASFLQAVEDHRHKFTDFFKHPLANSLSNFQIDYLQFLRCLTSSKCLVYILFPCFT